MIARRPRHRGDRRRGFGLVEMAVTGFLVVAAMAATLHVVGWVALDRRAVERRERAVLEASNLMERASGRPWDEITTEALGSIRLPDPAASSLPGSSLLFQVTASDDAPARKKILLEIRWNDRSGRPEAPVRLVAWAYRRGGPAR